MVGAEREAMKIVLPGKKKKNVFCFQFAIHTTLHICPIPFSLSLQPLEKMFHTADNFAIFKPSLFNLVAGTVPSTAFRVHGAIPIKFFQDTRTIQTTQKRFFVTRTIHVLNTI